MSKRKVKSPSNEGVDILTSTTDSISFNSASGFNQIGNGPVKITDTTDSTSTSTGSLVVLGGMGVTKNLNAKVLGLTPLSSDPSSPYTGMCFFSDGTPRAEGLWVYKGTGWASGGSGATGIQGIQGSTGIQGIQGPTGVLGINGVTGIQGVNVWSGLPLIWRNDDTFACEEVTRFGQLNYSFNTNYDQYLWTVIKVPNTYTVGKQITIKGKINCPTAAGGTILLSMQSTLITSGTALSSTAFQRVTTNTAVAINTIDAEYVIDWDITSGSGYVGAQQIAANDTILIKLYRASGDSNADNAYFMPGTSELIIAV